MHIDHHGARDGVTGSCHQLHLDAAHSLLIDCGLFQGAETSADGQSDAERLSIGFDISTVKALVATHVHIDHVGRIPYLLAAGFKGPILCSEPSAQLLPLVLEDAFRLGISRDAEQLQRYLKVLSKRIIALPYNTWFSLLDSPEQNVRLRLQRAGHILGSAYVEVERHDRQTGQQQRVVFSGDLGAPHAPLLPAPKPPYGADILVLESTYGDRNHEPRHNRRQRLQAMLEKALADNGTVLIPAFSIGRTQELLYELEDIIHNQLPQRAGPTSNSPLHQREGLTSNPPLPPGEGPGVRASKPAQNPKGHTEWPALPIILDSPLASRFTAAYQNLQPFWAKEALQRVRQGRQPLNYANLITVDSHTDHLKMVEHLAKTARPAIVIAASGMCAGGRIVNYLKAMLGDKRHNVLFVGYQAKGTPGQLIQQHGPRNGYVELDGERIQISAGIDSIGGYSAHADQRGLLNFASGMRKPPQQIRIVHGEPQAKRQLAKALQSRFAEKGRAVDIWISGEQER